MMAKQWTAHETLSWGMYGDETQPFLRFNSNDRLPPENRAYDQARRELRNAIARRDVAAHGFRLSVNQPPLARETLPAELFEQFPSLAVDAGGETTFMHPSSPQNIPLWRSIIFDPDEVRTLWPKPTPDVDAWMLNDFQTRPNEKRERRLTDCRSANNCTNKQALAAFNRVPSHFKRGRGQRIINQTR
jgi:hypothetical protein